MPRPTLPPTPASSTEMKGRDATAQLAALQTSFELPPPAVPASSNDLLPSDSKLSPGPHEPAINIECPTQASETVKSAPRRRSSAATAAAAATNTAAFALPPPPPRSRKIIHVKPSTRGPQWQAESEVSPSQPSSSKTTAGGAPGNGKGGRASSSSGTGTATGTIPATPTTAGPAETSSTSKRKAPSATSAAGRKIARKTAHSLIERRRRCKMNEEFGVLKDMIPACTGEMHKLAILQASIEYIRYLEDCVAKLKAREEERDMRDRTPPRDLALPPTAGHAADDNDDVIMAGSQTTTPLLPAMGRSHQSSSVSPGLQAQDTRLGPSQGSSVGSSSAEYHHHRHYSYGASPSSTVTSPAFGPRHSPHGGHYQHQPDANRVGSVPSSAPESTFTSPALAPQQPLRDLDQEASAALLMLNSDRRGSSGRGMSVRDLLST